jgi:putative membrane protein
MFKIRVLSSKESRSMLRLLATASVVALLAASPAFAQTTNSTGTMSNSGSRTTAQSDKLAKQDKNFVHEAAIGGMAEVELGKLAQQKAQSADVKQFGQRMEQDHSAANEQLMSVASSKNIDMPKQLDREHRQLRDKLAKANGAQFDREYMQAMVKDHKKDIKEFEKEAKSGKDADIKNFAQSTLPTLQQHLQMAQDIERNMRSQTPMASRRNNSTAGTAGTSTPTTQR